MKVFQRAVIVFLCLAAILSIAFIFFKSQTKKHSPEQTTSYKIGSADVNIFYNSPSKKGRVIFGDLVQYDKIWRTGANEPTTFETSAPILVGGETLEAGKYSLWTKPNPDKWTVYFNSDIPRWGVGKDGASREAEFDVIALEVLTQTLTDTVQDFTIDITKDSLTHLNLSWDLTKISVPIEAK